jgi:hypothetical protein
MQEYEEEYERQQVIDDYHRERRIRRARIRKRLDAVTQKNQTKAKRRAIGEENVSSDDEYPYENSEDGLSEEDENIGEHIEPDCSHTCDHIGESLHLNWFGTDLVIPEVQPCTGDSQEPKEDEKKASSDAKPVKFNPVIDTNFGHNGFVVDREVYNIHESRAGKYPSSHGIFMRSKVIDFFNRSATHSWV